MAHETPTSLSTSSLDEQFYLPPDEFFLKHSDTALTYDDVSLATRFSEVLPRDASVATRISPTLELAMPIMSADMDTVTESAMAVAMARNGGMGIIHYNMTPDEQRREVARVKNDVHGLIQEPISVNPEDNIGQVLDRIESKGYKFRTFPVVEKGTGKFVGLLRGTVVKQRYRSVRVSEAMTPREEVYTIYDTDIAGDPIGAADRFFTEHMGIHKLIVIDKDEILRGLFTMTDIERIREEESQTVKPARDAKFRLICAAALSAPRNADGTLNEDEYLEHAQQLIGEGLDAFAVSTAHGHSAGVAQAVRLLRLHFPDTTIIAGNVTSAEGVEFLAKAGADCIKIGQGPGSICTTRIVAGVGIPQLTALYVASKVARKLGVRIMADGGITKSGDIVKALTLADCVLCGSLLAGCREAPGQIVEINGKLYKQYRGMGSQAAMKAGAAARYGHDNAKMVGQKVAAEGIEALKEVSGGIDDTLRELVGGIKSGMGYLGAANLGELRKRARFVRITNAGMRESAPHDIIEVKATKAEA